MKRTIFQNVKAVLGHHQQYQPQAVDIVMEGSVISGIFPAYTATDGEIISMTGRLVVPGLIDGHLHSHEHFQKGRFENLPLELWMNYVRTVKPVILTPRQVYLRTLVGAIEAMRSGTTTIVDDMSPGSVLDPEMIEAVFQAYEDIGMRAVVGFSMMDRPIVDNYMDVDQVFPAELAAQLRALPRPDPAALMAMIRKLAIKRHPSQNRIGVMVSPSAPHRCSGEFLQACRALADELDLPSAIHVQETRLQVVTGMAFYGKTMVARLAELGFLKDKTTLIHAVWLNPDELKMIADAGTTVQHNAWSNLMLGSGSQPVREVLDAGINLSLGADGCSSTVTCNMLNVMGTAAALSKIRDNDYTRWLSAAESLKACTVGGAHALGLGKQLGVIAIGMKADLVIYKLDTPTFTPLADPVRQLVYAERGQSIESAYVDGEPVMRDGQLTRIDESSLLREIQSTYESLCPQFDEAEASVGPMRVAMEEVYKRSLKHAIPVNTFAARF
jgi:guanine deaminase